MSTADIATYAFTSREDAEDFVRDCCKAELFASYRATDSHEVRVEIATYLDRRTADALALQAPCVAYEFGKKA